MKFSVVTALTVGLAAEGVLGSTWLGTKPAYNKWHETELERWLSDNNIPYPAASDRKDLESNVKENWDAYAVKPYQKWQVGELTSWLSKRGQQVKKGTEQNTEALISQVQSAWTDTEDTVSHAYANTRDWIFDSWTDSQLKSFADKHGIPVPQPRTRDTLLQTVRSNYQTAANKANEYYHYPGAWIYASWSDSDLKAWLDERGYPAPQTSSRDKLIASVRRNSRLASVQAQQALSSASAEAAKATNYLSEELLNSWSDSKIKEWADKNGIKVPQGSKRNELIALARKHRELLAKSASSASNSASSYYGDASYSASSSASSYYGAASTMAGNEYAKATDDAALYGQQAYGALGYYTNLIKQKLGLGTVPASASSYASSLTGAASKSASSASSRASVEASKASKSASSAASILSKHAKGAKNEL